eukprot:3462642-Pyramimonas_sp.AAC.1
MGGVPQDVKAVDSKILTELEQKVQGLRGGCSSAASVDSGPTTAASSRGPSSYTRDWNPSCLEIKGWVQNWAKRERRGKDMLCQHKNG